MCGGPGRDSRPCSEWKDHMFPTKDVFRRKKEGVSEGGYCERRVIEGQEKR